MKDVKNVKNVKDMKNKKNKNISETESRVRTTASWLLGLFIGFLSGGLVGAGVMFLLAPRSGKRTRSQIQHKGTQLRHQATEGMEDLVTEAGDAANQFTDGMQKQVGKLQRRAGKVINGVKK